jgi:hypothetical protein
VHRASFFCGNQVLIQTEFTLSVRPSLTCLFVALSFLRTSGLVGAPACGDVMKLQIKVGEDGKIQDAVFKVCICVEGGKRERVKGKARNKSWSAVDAEGRKGAKMLFIVAVIPLRRCDLLSVVSQNLRAFLFCADVWVRFSDR